MLNEFFNNTQTTTRNISKNLQKIDTAKKKKKTFLPVIWPLSIRHNLYKKIFVEMQPCRIWNLVGVLYRIYKPPKYQRQYSKDVQLQNRIIIIIPIEILKKFIIISKIGGCSCAYLAEVVQKVEFNGGKGLFITSS